MLSRKRFIKQGILLLGIIVLLTMLIPMNGIPAQEHVLVELTHLRTQTSKTYWDGETFSCDISMSWIHYDPAPNDATIEWLEPNLNISKSGVITEAPYDLQIFLTGVPSFRYSSKYTGVYEITIGNARDPSISEPVDIKPSSFVKPVIDGNICTWSDVYPGVDIVLEAHTTGVGLYRYIKNDKAPTEFDTTIETLKIGGNCKVLGTVPAMDAGGQSLLMEESVNGDVITQTLKLERPMEGQSIAPVTYPIKDAIIIDEQVMASLDDGCLTGIFFYPTAVDINIGSVWVIFNLLYDAWYRFDNIYIPNGATIANAYIQLYDRNTCVGVPQTRIYADDQANPSYPTTSADYNGRPVTTAFTNWSGQLVGSPWASSPSITAVIQELANTYDYTSGYGNAIQILHKNNGSPLNARQQTYSYDFAPANAPKLHFEYNAVLPTMTTEPATDIEGDNATLHGTCTDSGGALDERGFVWDDASHGDPGNVAPGSTSYDDNWTETGTYWMSAFQHIPTTLVGGTTYYYRSCGYNEAGWSYGDEETFDTCALPDTPVIISPTDGETDVETDVTIVGPACGGDSSQYRRDITVTNTGAGTLTDYQVMLTINTQSIIAAGKMQANGADIRFGDDGGPCDYWIQSGIGTTTTKIWVEMNTIPVGASTLRFFYGDPGAAPGSSIPDTFPSSSFSDSFDDTSKLSSYNNVTISGGQIELTDEGAAISDEFSSSTLDPKWTWFNAPGCWARGGFWDVDTTTADMLHITTDTYTDATDVQQNGHFLWQNVSGNFDLTIKVYGNPNGHMRQSGITVMPDTGGGTPDPNNAFKFGYGCRQVIFLFQGIGIFTLQGGVYSSLVEIVDPGSPKWLRLRRTGNIWDAWYSENGTSWNYVQGWTQVLSDPLMVGFGAGDGADAYNYPTDMDFFHMTKVKPAGDATSVTIPTSASQRWAVGRTFDWNKMYHAGTDDIEVQFYYWTGAAWTLIPDGVLPGNSAGFTSTTVDLSVIDEPDVYDQIRVKASLTGGATTPELYSWTVPYYYRKYSSPEPTAGAPGAETHCAHDMTDWQISDDGTFSGSDICAYSYNDAANMDQIQAVSTEMTFQNSLSGWSELQPETQYWVRARYHNDGGWGSWGVSTHDFTTRDFYVPDTPSITYPTDEATGISCTVTFTSSAYSGEQGTTHTHTDWQVSINSDFELDHIVAFSVRDTTNKTSIAVTSMTFINDLAGATTLDPLTTYYVQVRYENEGGHSLWSASDHNFTTGAGTVPITPSITHPYDAEVDLGPNPLATSSAYIGCGTHLHSDWEISDDGTFSGSDICVVSYDDTSNKVSIHVDTIQMTFQNSLNGKTGLALGTQYWMRVRHANSTGDSSWSVSTLDFTTISGGGIATPSITYPTNGATGISVTVTITSSAYSGSGTHASSDWQISDSGVWTGPGTDICAYAMNDTIQLTSCSSLVYVNSLDGYSQLKYSTTYWVRVRYTDENGASLWSSNSHSFTTAASGALGPPTNFDLAKDSDTEVTVTWTKDPSASSTIVVRKTGEYPSDPSDGIEVYNGGGATVQDTQLHLDDTAYWYRAWSELDGGYSSNHAQGKIGGDIVLFLGLIILAGVCTAIAWRTRFLPFSMAAGLSWLVLGILCWTSPDTIGVDAMSTAWAQALGFLFLLMTIGPLLLQMRSDIKHEAKTREGEVISWTSQGNPPEKKVTRSQKVQKEYTTQLRDIKKRNPPSKPKRRTWF